MSSSVAKDRQDAGMRSPLAKSKFFFTLRYPRDKKERSLDCEKHNVGLSEKEEESIASSGLPTNFPFYPSTRGRDKSGRFGETIIIHWGI